MLPVVLNNLTFRSDNRFQPVIKALAAIKRYFKTTYTYFPEDVPLKGVVTGSWEDVVVETVKGKKKVNLKRDEAQLLGNGVISLGREVDPDSPLAIHYAIKL